MKCSHICFSFLLWVYKTRVITFWMKYYMPDINNRVSGDPQLPGLSSMHKISEVNWVNCLRLQNTWSGSIAQGKTLSSQATTSLYNWKSPSALTWIPLYPIIILFPALSRPRGYFVMNIHSFLSSMWLILGA